MRALTTIKAFCLSIALVAGLATSAPAWTVSSNFDAQDCNWIGDNDSTCLSVNSGVMQIRLGVGRNGSGAVYYYFDYPVLGNCRPESGVPWPPGGQCGGFWSRNIPATTTGHLYVQFYMYLGSDFIESSFTKIIRGLHMGSGLQPQFNADWFDFAFGSSGTAGNPALSWNLQNGTIIASDTGLFPKNAWHCITIHYGLNPVGGVANGTFAMSIDGTLNKSASNIMYRTAGDNTSVPVLNRIGRQQGQGTMYMDDWSASDSPLSCSGVIPPTTIYPVVTTVTTRATGATVGGTQTSPDVATTMTITYGNNTIGTPTTVTVPIAQFPGWASGGVYTFSWPAGTEFACFTPNIANGTSGGASSQGCAAVALSDVIAPATPSGLTIR